MVAATVLWKKKKNQAVVVAAAVLHREIFPPVLFTLHIIILWSQTSQSLTVFIWKNINICHAKVIQYETLSHNTSIDIDFRLWMLILFFIKLIKLYEAWLQSNLICKLKRPEGVLLKSCGAYQGSACPSLARAKYKVDFAHETCLARVYKLPFQGWLFLPSMVVGGQSTLCEACFVLSLGAVAKWKPRRYTHHCSAWPENRHLEERTVDRWQWFHGPYSFQLFC